MEPTVIKTHLEELLRRMNIVVERIEIAETDSACRFAVTTNDSNLLIGPRGAHLFALNHLVRKIAAKGAVEKVSPEGSAGTALSGAEMREISVDINGYQEAAAAQLKNLAKIMGERARSFKVNVTLEPMSSYERMIVHSFLEDAPDLATESVGEGENRRVVIKYTGDL